MMFKAESPPQRRAHGRRGAQGLMASLPLLMSLLVGGCTSGPHGADPTPTAGAAEVEGRILFVGTQPSGRTDLYMIDRDGRQLDVLTEGILSLSDGQTITTSEGALQPSPSQDGQLVLFSLERAADGAGAVTRTLYEVAVSSRTAYPLGEAPEGLRRAFYDRSGARILLDVREPSSGRGSLMLWTEDGPQALAPEGQELLFDGFFSDEDRLLVRSGSGADRQLAVLDLATGELTPFGEAGGLEVLSPRLSPDGARVVFQGRAQPEACYDLFSVAVAMPGPGDALQPPVPLGAAEGAWSVVYGDGSSPGDHQPGDGEDAAPTGEDSATPPQAGYATTECLSVSAPTWSRGDPDRIAFLATTDPFSGRADAFTLDLSGGEIGALTADLSALGPGVTSTPRWAPDGDTLLFTFSWQEAEGDPQQVDLYVAHPGDEPTPLTDGYAGVPSLAHWDSTSERVLFWSRSVSGEQAAGSSDAVVVDLETGSIDAITAGRGLHVAYPQWLAANSILY